LVLTCDRLPRSLLALEERLRERFEAGLVAEMVAPNHATRVAILGKRAELDHIAIEDGAVLDLIAERVTSNVRTLEGALIRVVAHHSLTQRPIDLALATEVMDGMYPSSAGSRTPTIEEIQQVVSGFYEISVAELVSPSRRANIAWARQVAIHLARDLSGTSLQTIGTAFGGRNHGTVLHACKRVSDRVHNDQQAADQVSELDELVRARHVDRHC
jgi:chromosomal replication initiator protein